MKNFVKLLQVIILGLFLTTQSAHSKDIKFVQISDVHYSTGANSQKVLEETVADINKLDNIDFVMFTGDNVDKPKVEDLIQFLKTSNKLNVPYYVLIGNHDVFKSKHLDKKEYMKVVSQYSDSMNSKSPNYVFKEQNLVFIVVDGAKEIIPGGNGYFKKETLAWLDKKLTKYADDKVIIFQHFPLVEPIHKPSHVTYNVQDYAMVLKKHSNVIAIFSGHYHMNFEKEVKGIYNVSTPSLSMPPYSYKVVDIKVTKNPKTKKPDYAIFTQLREVEHSESN